jgi:hypothetical protein
MVFSIESYNEGNLSAYTRIRSAGDTHFDVKERFATVLARLNQAIQGASESRLPPEVEPDEADPDGPYLP